MGGDYEHRFCVWDNSNYESSLVCESLPTTAYTAMKLKNILSILEYFFDCSTSAQIR